MDSSREQSIGIALIGPGSFGSTLARALAEDHRVALVGVLGAAPAESAAGAAALGGRAFASLDELLRADDVAAVIVATPNDTHPALAIAAARAGKHVFCEKPLALTAAECDAMIAAAERASVTLTVGHVLRLVPLLAEVRRLVREGAIGAPAAVQMYRHELLARRPGSWLEQRARVGSLVHQISIHEIDWLRALLGEVAEVFARAAPPTRPELDYADAVELSLRFRSGCIATLSSHMNSFIPSYGGTIQGTSGSLAFDMNRGTLSWRGQAGAEGHGDGYAFGAGVESATRAELRAFVDAVLGLAPPLIPGAEGRANVEVVQAALASIAEGRAVALPLVPVRRSQ